MITYKDFVTELKTIVTEGDSLKGTLKRDKDPYFRKWRLKLSDLILEVEKLGYSINCDIDNRKFGGVYGEISIPEYERDGEYNHELQDTLNELTLIIENYDKYGEPQSEKQAEVVSENKGINPDQIPTIKELLFSLKVHHGWKTIVAILAILTVTFQAGVYIERYLFSLSKASSNSSQKIEDSVHELTWLNATTKNLAPSQDIAIDTRKAQSLSIEAEPLNNTTHKSNNIILSVLASAKKEGNYKAYYEDNITNNNFRATPMTPYAGYLKLRLSVNDGLRADVKVIVKVVY